MAEDHRLQEFLSRNADFAKTHQPIHLLKDTLFANGPDPKGNLVIGACTHVRKSSSVSQTDSEYKVSCFDTRIHPNDFFGIKPGEANILNNAGGRVDSDAIRSLIALDSIAGVSTVIVIHHTDCGLTHSTDVEIKGKLIQKAPEHANEIDGMKFGEITDLQQSVKDDMKLVKTSPYLKKDLKVLGFVYDITQGTVKEVKVD